jgi:hypothetical protein
MQIHSDLGDQPFSLIIRKTFDAIYDLQNIYAVFLSKYF